MSTPAGRVLRRSLLAPEVVQTSAMDCGPASLKCLLEGHGIPVSYGRLREACQTDVDGTSIDALEVIANQLGLHAEQVMVPLDHLFLAEAENLPALVVVRLPNGFTHFVVVWRSVGPFVQVMDPETGRRWMRRQKLLEEIFLHETNVPANSWREWAGTEEFLTLVRESLRELGASREAPSLIADACADPGWRSLGALDAATRMVASIIRSGGLDRGAAAARLVGVLFAEARRESSSTTAVIPPSYWSARAPDSPTSGDGELELRLRGAVLLRVRGAHSEVAATDGQEAPPPLSPELAAALAEPPARPGRELLRMLRQDGQLGPAVILGALVLAAGGAVLEALLFRSVFDLGQHLTLVRQRLVAATALIGFAMALLAVELPLGASLLRLGRHLEARLRVAFLAKIPRLGDRYFQSRPISDMAERVHSVQLLRLLPELGAELSRAVLTLAATTAGLIWLDRSCAPIALCAAALAITLPLALQPPLVERDLRLRSHAGSLGRFYLDALLGLIAIRTHAAEAAVRQEHEGLLVEWARAGRSALRAAAAIDLVQSVAGLAMAGLLLHGYLARADRPGGVLLFIYWALELPALGQQIALAARQYPARRNITLRLFEPLGAPDAGAAAVAAVAAVAGGPVAQTNALSVKTESSTPTALATTSSVKADASTRAEAAAGGMVRPGSGARRSGVSLRFESVSIVAAGHRILDEIDFSVKPGEQIAIVGPSGAGKSSLMGVLLGWHRPAAGRVLCDDAPLDAEGIDRLRPEVAWVDPAVQLWNRTLLENLCYGSHGGVDRVAGILDAADLHRVLAGLPDGLQSPLGEGGALVSGGEGQRVRLGRAMLREGVRLALLDEPFRGLDRETRRTLMARTRAFFEGATLLCVTHDVGETLGFSRVLVVDGGRVVEDDAPQVLAAQSHSRYRALLDAEAAVRVGLWSSSAWRRLRLTDGKIVEGHEPHEPTSP